MLKRIKLITICLWLTLLTLVSCKEASYRIGVTQCYHNDWNRQLDRDLKLGANSHPDIDFDIRLTHQGIQGQISDIRHFITQRVDLIMIAPELESAISPIVEEAIAAGIPVVMIDTETSSCNFTALVCVDNKEIGRKGAQFAASSLGGQGKVISIMGVEGSSNSEERHEGFVEGIASFPDIQIIDSCYTQWTYESAYPLLDSLLTLHPDVDLLACQSDPIAIAAFDVCQKHQLEEMPFILGVDALTGEGNGIQSVLEGKISGTCSNPTGGKEAINIALDILEGRPYERINILPCRFINQENAALVMEQETRINQLNDHIEKVNGSLGRYFRRAYLFQLFIIAATLVLLLICGFTVFALRTNRQKNLLRKKVEESNQSKLSFFANVSHSFRTPLSLISDPIQTLLNEGQLNERQTEMLQLMAKNAEELQKLTDKVLSVLQDDLLKDGKSLDAVAQQSAQNTISLTEMRNRTFGAHPDIEADQNRRSILIIDDNIDIRRYLALVFSQRNYVVLTAPNGEEGLLVAKQNIPDVIICDVMMPIMDGLECCRLLKADMNTSHIPVLLLTAYALDDQRIQGYESGADAYITKPFNTQVLCARISNLLDNRKLFNADKDRQQEMDRTELSSVDRSLVNHFHSFVTQNLSNLDLDIQQLCDEFGMSRVQLYRKCKSITGQSPIELVRIIRLKAATTLLETSNKSISEIGYETGFSSPSYFAKCYKDQYGESPTDVQKRAREAAAAAAQTEKPQ